jgi:hypothetical protein
MANRLTKGKALFGSIVSSGTIKANLLSQQRSINNIADGASMAISAANVVAGVVTATPTTARNIQAPTASSLVSALVGETVGDSIEVTIINLSASAANMTLTVNTGTTIVGSATIASASSATFLVRIASSSAVVFYRK